VETTVFDEILSAPYVLPTAISKTWGKFRELQFSQPKMNLDITLLGFDLRQQRT
jgi:hypothetical protein